MMGNGVRKAPSSRHLFTELHGDRLGGWDLSLTESPTGTAIIVPLRLHEVGDHRIVDLDETLVASHYEKELAEPTWLAASTLVSGRTTSMPRPRANTHDATPLTCENQIR